MVRLLVVLAVVAGVVLATALHRRRSARLADRSGFVHPPLPPRLRGPGRTWVVFSTTYCATCGPVADRLRRLLPDDTVRTVLVEDEPALADAYAIRTAPTVVETDASGHVVHSVAGASPVLRYVDSLTPA